MFPYINDKKCYLCPKIARLNLITIHKKDKSSSYLFVCSTCQFKLEMSKMKRTQPVEIQPGKIA